MNKWFENCDLVLSGGGLKGIFQCGVLDAFYEDKIKFKRIFGNSVGSINAVGYALEKQRMVSAIWLAIAKGKIKFFSKGIFGLSWIFRFFFKNSMYDNSNLRKLLTDLYGDRTYFPYGQPFVDTVDLMTGELYNATIENGQVKLITKSGGDGDVFPLDKWVDFILASTSIPVAFNPVKMFSGKAQFVDGGVRNLTPTGFPINLGSTKMLIILTGPLESEPVDERSGALEIGSRALSLNLNEIYKRDISVMQIMNECKADGKKFVDFKLIIPKYTINSLEATEQDMVDFYNHGYAMGKRFLNELNKEN